MYIKIEKCSLPAGWYKDLVSFVIEVDKEDETRYYSSTDNNWYVLKEDARVISKERNTDAINTASN
jgi:hypothetical protein